MNPMLLADAYKVSHPDQYPPGTEFVYSNTTARKSRMKGVDEVVVFGIQYLVLKYLVEEFDYHFFMCPHVDVLGEIKSFHKAYFGAEPSEKAMKRYEDLRDLGYLPIRVKALPEGTRCPIGVPFMTIENTLPEFYWVTNFVETLTQTVIWNMITAATISDRYRRLLDKYAKETGDESFVQFQGHNFSMRGMSSVESGMTTDMGHLLSFVGSDTLPGAYGLRRYYGDSGHCYGESDTELVACSIGATEHAVMSAGGDQDERETFRRLIQDVYPSGFVSIVSDTWNLWDVLTKIAPSLKAEIEARDGRVILRPDSGIPERIICGYRVKDVDVLPSTISKWMEINATDDDECDALRTLDGRVFDLHGKELSENEIKGCIRLLDEHFGSTVNEKGYKVLNPKVGLIYGDAIYYERAQNICELLKQMGYATTNIVLGIGSWTFQYNTRDTFGIACKATWAQVNGTARELFKDPITDDGTKKSARGLLCVYKDTDGTLRLKDRCTREEEEASLMHVVYEDGVATNLQDYREIRKRLAETRHVD